MRRLLLVATVFALAGCTQQVQAEEPVLTTAPPVTTTTTTTTTTPPPPPPPPPPPTPCDITDGACIQLSTNQTWILRDNKIFYGPVPITSGRAGYETPVGKFPVLRKVRNDWSKPYRAWMPYSTYFTHSGIAFHEGSLTEKSHGCIHLARGAAATYFSELSIGETVQVVA